MSVGFVAILWQIILLLLNFSPCKGTANISFTNPPLSEALSIMKVNSAPDSNQNGCTHSITSGCNDILDVMFLFTPQALAAVGGTDMSIQAIATKSVQLANDAYSNSNIPIRMREVGVFLVQNPSYTESGFQEMLTQLRNTDGILDNDVALREKVGADSVVLFVRDSSYCGLSVQGATAELAFAVVSTQCPASVVHEIGHNMGCHHDRLTEGNTNVDAYSFGYCWDTSATTCSRSVMAYGGCITPNKQTNCAPVLYFSSPLITYGGIGKTTGISTADNARFITEQVRRVTNWAPSKINGGLIFAASPAGVAVDRCEPVTIQGWRLGNGSDIVRVSLNGVSAQRILSQTVDSVQVLAGASTVAGVGDIVVTTSTGYSTTLSGAFAYEATSGIFGTDFDSSLGPYWTSAGALQWSIQRYCDALPCATPPISGPSVGADGTGSFAKLVGSDVSGESGWLTATFNANEHGCSERVHSVSLVYHLWNPYSSQCGGSLTVSMLSATAGTWTTVLTGRERQSSQDDAWIPLLHTFAEPLDVKEIRITAVPFTGMATCQYWSSVSVDHIIINKTMSCPNSGCELTTLYPSAAPSPTPSGVPTFVPSSIAPTVAPSLAPTFPLVDAVEMIHFTTALTFTGMTSLNFLAQPATIVAVLNVVADLIQVTVDDLCCTKLTDLVVAEREGMVLGAGSSRVTFAFQVQLTVSRLASLDVIGTRSASLSPVALTAFDDARHRLAQGVTAGDILHALASVLPDDASDSIGVESVSNSSFTALWSVVQAVDNAPTATPTPSAGISGSFVWSGASLFLGICLFLGMCAFSVWLMCAPKKNGIKRDEKCNALSEVSSEVLASADKQLVNEHLREIELSSVSLQDSAHSAIPEDPAIARPRSVSRLLPSYMESLYSPRSLLSPARKGSTPSNAYQPVSTKNQDEGDVDKPPYQDILDKVNERHSRDLMYSSSPLHRIIHEPPGHHSQLGMPRSARLPFPPGIMIATHAEGVSAHSTPSAASRNSTPRSLRIAPRMNQQAFPLALTVDTTSAPVVLRGPHSALSSSHAQVSTPHYSLDSSARAVSSGKYHAFLAKRLESPNAVAGFSPTSAQLETGD